MSNTAKAKKLMEDYVHSGALQTMSLADVIQVRDELADLWILIDGTDIVPGMTEQAVRDALSPPAEQYDGVWLYPSTFEEYYYRIDFDAGVVKETDFVALNIS
ncbi:MAG TPA: hypothetical protein PKW08_01550 [Flavobacteriaceae bacterium]|nr:hypothetical protein [Flavobacteriaceae bacterium]MCB9212498.1 hypothetical protein [Alteromonas sp.]HPF10561.1 hypothetical protein [Flavobacteriaceae bacterium]HQU20249.1 hypothetical protein [Flavobacteriaceae bacterium]HQU66009.1 hypothetical protein [Flavobacteriaceae bacterium]